MCRTILYLFGEFPRRDPWQLEFLFGGSEITMSSCKMKKKEKEKDTFSQKLT